MISMQNKYTYVCHLLANIKRHPEVHVIVSGHYLTISINNEFNIK